jgi:hypothetical protein
VSEKCRVSCQNKFVKLIHLFGCITEKFITMHGHMNVKKMFKTGLICIVFFKNNIQDNYIINITYPLTSVIYLNYKFKKKSAFFAQRRILGTNRVMLLGAVIGVIPTVIQITCNHALCVKVLRFFMLEEVVYIVTAGF